MQIDQYDFTPQTESLMDLLQQTQQHLDKNLPFVWYVTPNSNKLCAWFQKTNHLHRFKEQEGFLMAPFLSANDEIYVLPFAESDYLEEEMNFLSNVKSKEINLETENAQAQFEAIVCKAVAAIQNEAFTKVVLSRKITIPIQINALEVFQRMASTYRNAFCYLFSHPELGSWMGATPEQLIKFSNNHFETVSLAGTQRKVDFKEWSSKEKQEQQYVTDFILDSLHTEVESLKVTPPETIEAGSLVHLKTTISGTVFSNKNSLQLVKNLHPTPAVCGLPKEAALDFILANEGYDREFYTGFVGLWNASAGGNLFVNLRCMKVAPEEVTLFVGCGITKDSNPEAEFFETEHKSMTMRNIL